MIYLILLAIFIFVTLFAIAVGFLINYHFKKLGVDNDKNSQKIMSIYKKGVMILVILTAFTFFLLVIIK